MEGLFIDYSDSFPNAVIDYANVLIKKIETKIELQTVSVHIAPKFGYNLEIYLSEDAYLNRNMIELLEINERISCVNYYPRKFIISLQNYENFFLLEQLRLLRQEVAILTNLLLNKH